MKQQKLHLNLYIHDFMSRNSRLECIQRVWKAKRSKSKRASERHKIRASASERASKSKAWTGEEQLVVHTRARQKASF